MKLKVQILGHIRWIRNPKMLKQLNLNQSNHLKTKSKLRKQDFRQANLKQSLDLSHSKKWGEWMALTHSFTLISLICRRPNSLKLHNKKRFFTQMLLKNKRIEILQNSLNSNMLIKFLNVNYKTMFHRFKKMRVNLWLTNTIFLNSTST